MRRRQLKVLAAWGAHDPFFAGPGRERKAAVIYTRGVYSPGAPLVFGADFHSTFLNDWLRFASFTDVTDVTDVTELRHQSTVLTATPDDDRNAAIAAAATAGNTF
jgi:FMN-dependent NADH-azoreductase